MRGAFETNGKFQSDGLAKSDFSKGNFDEATFATFAASLISFI